MSAPARAGVFIYAKDPDRLSAFYRAVLGLAVAHRTGEMAVLRSPDLELVVHAMPPQLAERISITSPPQLRDTAAIKFFATVESLAAAQASAGELGGRVFQEQWRGPGFVVCNASDPEGNIFQLRQSTADPLVQVAR